ncbi:MAG: cell division protein FtsL [Kofleriaceae bacterium]|nr:cell division protein FtsL [Kofleriaceae bacterium]
MNPPLPRIYRLLKSTAHRAPKAHRGVLILFVTFAFITMAALMYVGRRHAVLRYGYQLSRASQRVAALRESNRRLDIELAMLSAPERIRGLATQLGMIPVPPDRIRVVHGALVPTVELQPTAANQPRLPSPVVVGTAAPAHLGRTP